MKTVTIHNDPLMDYSVNEAMNTLATNLSFCGDDVRCVLVTSRYASEGKSTVSFKLAQTLANLGRNVVLVDTDLRRSEMVRKYQMEFEDQDYMGLAHYLSGQCDIDDIVYESNIEGMYLIPIGREVLSSLKLLTSPRTSYLLQEMRRNADIVIVDTSPAGVIVDALEVAKSCDGALVVVGHNQGHMHEVNQLKQNIERSGCPVLGAVLNAVPRESYTNRKYYYKNHYYNGYYYRNTSKKDNKKKASE